MHKNIIADKKEPKKINEILDFSFTFIEVIFWMSARIQWYCTCL